MTVAGIDLSASAMQLSPMTGAEAQLEQFLAKYDPAIAETGRAAIAHLRGRLPEWDVLVYDNYNALAAAFSPDGGKRLQALSIALYPRWVSLFVSARLDDPQGILKGSGGTVRHVVLEGGAGDLERPEIAALIDQTIERAKAMNDPARRGELKIASVSAKQRPRRAKG
jgi:hypothetical protein